MKEGSTSGMFYDIAPMNGGDEPEQVGGEGGMSLRYLSPDQVRQVLALWKQQAEVKLLETWLAYETARRDLEWLEQQETRLCSPLPSR